MQRLGIILLVILGIAAAVLFSTTYIIRETNQAILLEFGAEVGDPKTEAGLYFKLPYQSVTYFDKRVLNLDPEPESFLLVDQKPLVVDYYLRYKIVEPLAYFKAVGTEAIAVSRLKKTVNGKMRAALGQATLEDVLSDKRTEILGEVQKSVAAETKDLGIDVVDVRIGKADLPTQISRNVYDRMRAERERLAQLARSEGREIELREQSRANLERTELLAEAEREAKQIRGSAEADAQRILNAAYGKDTEFFGFLKSMDAYKTTLASEGSYKILGTDSEFLKRLQSTPKQAAE